MATYSSIDGSDATYFQDCDACKYQNATSEAVSFCTNCSEYLCTACDKAHRGSKLTRNHKLLAGSNLPSESTRTKQTSSIMFCEEHNTMVVDMYCKRHDGVICRACKVTSHRNCKITDLSEQTKQMKEDGSFNKTKAHLENLKFQYDNMKAAIKKDNRRNKSQLETCRKDMQLFRKQVIETLDTIDMTLSEEIKHAEEKTTKDIEGHIAICDDALTQIMEIWKTLKECENTQDYQGMFVGMKMASIAQKKYADTIVTIQHDIHQTETKFELNDSLFDVLKQLHSVDTVLVDKQCIRAGVTYELQKSVLDMSISCRRDINIGDTGVYGCTFMPDGHLVLCCGEEGLKLLDNDFNIKSQLTETALCAAVINDKEIVVTQGGYKQMKRVTIFPQMKVSQTIEMDRPCRGVDVYGDVIYVTCCDYYGSEVRVLNMEGKVQRTLGLNNGKYMFKWPIYVIVNNAGSKVFVTDSGTHTVTCLDTQVHVIYQYSDRGLKGPRGMYVDYDDNLLVCGYKSNNVHAIGQHGRKEKILLSEGEGVLNPWCIAFRQSDGCLVVGIQNNKNKSLISYTVK